MEVIWKKFRDFNIVENRDKYMMIREDGVNVHERCIFLHNFLFKIAYIDNKLVFLEICNAELNQVDRGAIWDRFEYCYVDEAWSDDVRATIYPGLTTKQEIYMEKVPYYPLAGGPDKRPLNHNNQQVRDNFIKVEPIDQLMFMVKRLTDIVLGMKEHQ